MPEIEKNLNYVLTASNNGAAAFRSFGQGLEDVGNKAEKTASKLKQAEGGLAGYAKRVKDSLGEDRAFKGILQGGLTGSVGDQLARSTAKMPVPPPFR